MNRRDFLRQFWGVGAGGYLLAQESIQVPESRPRREGGGRRERGEGKGSRPDLENAEQRLKGSGESDRRDSAVRRAW